MAVPEIRGFYGSAGGEKLLSRARDARGRSFIKMNRFRKLSHATWECKYHVVWIPKYRRKELYGKRRVQVVRTIRRWAEIKGVEILEGHALRDHLHLCIAVPPKYSVASIVGLLKGKSASEVMCFGSRSTRMARGRHFWARGYCVSTVGLDEETIRHYIRNQEQEDKRQEELNFD
jgi:putative transposase